jgi:predicted Zn-dependent protease
LAGSGEAPIRQGTLGYLFGRAGRTNDALNTLGLLRSRGKTEYVPASAIASVYLGLGRRSEALNELERAFAQRDAWLVWLKVHRMYDDIRGEPRFQRLVQQMNFPP